MKKLADVFGVSQSKKESYVSRAGVDDKFDAALETDRHILIYGSSKQGKTSLREKRLTKLRMFTYPCGYKTKTESIYQAILNDANVTIETGEARAVDAKLGAKAGFFAKALFTVFGGVGANAEVSAERGSRTERYTESVSLDLGEAQAVISLLQRQGYDKVVVLENFHYLAPEVQKALAIDLKAFHEAPIRFLIIGVWKESNYLTMYNSDLSGRIEEIPVEPWTDGDFDRVIAKGCEALNIKISSEARKELKRNAFGNVGLLQDFLAAYCRLADVKEAHPGPTPRTLSSKTHIEEALLENLAKHKAKLQPTLRTIAAKSRTATHTEDPLILPYYLVKVILETPIPELMQGIHRQRLHEKIQAVHHRKDKSTIRSGDISNLLKNLPAYQDSAVLPLLSYDENDKLLKVVDATQFFVLDRIDKEQLWQEIPHPLGPDE